MIFSSRLGGRDFVGIFVKKKKFKHVSIVGLDIPDYITDDVRPREVQDIIKRLKEKHYLWYFEPFSEILIFTIFRMQVVG